MKFLLGVFLLFALNQARITISLEKIHIDSQTSQSELNENAVSLASGFLSPDSMELSLFNARNFFYFGNIFVGSNNLTMKVLFDTGSNDLWLSASSCVGCPGTVRFDCKKSTTCKKSNDPKSLAYGLGKVSGYVGSDMIGLTPTFRVESPILMVSSGADLKNYYLVEGFIGLGSKNNAKDFIDLAYDAGQIDSKIFSIHLDYNPDVTREHLTTGTYMTIGYVPEDKINNMAWIPVTVSDRWSTDILGVKIGDKILSGSDVSGTVLFDTGASLMYLTPAVKGEFLNQLNKFEKTFYVGIAFWPCEDDDLGQYPNISLSVSGLRIDITPASYFDFPSAIIRDDHVYCQQLVQTSTFGMSILGDAFLKENFIAYSKLNQTIGVNLAAGHQVLPSPNPPLYVILVLFFLMIVIGAYLLMEQKKRITKTALAADDTLPSHPNSNSVVY